MCLQENITTAEIPPDTILLSFATTRWIWSLRGLYKKPHGSELWSSVSWTPLRFPGRTFPLSQEGRTQRREQCRCRPQGMGCSRNVLDFSEEEKNKTVLVTFCMMTNRPLIPVPAWTNFTHGVFLWALVRAAHAWMQQLPGIVWEIWHSKKSISKCLFVSFSLYIIV